MGLTLTTGPETEPVTTAEMKSHSRIDTDVDDALVAAYIKAARVDTETFLWRQIITATYTLTLDRFPLGDFIELPRPPLISVTSVKYYDTANVQQTLSDSGYEVDVSTEPGRIYVDRSDMWPSVYDRRNAVEVIYTAGYGASSDVPDAIKQSIKFKAAHYYENREALTIGVSAMETPMAAQRLDSLMKFRGLINVYEDRLTAP